MSSTSHPTVPLSYSVEAAKCVLDEREQRGEHQRAGEEQNGLDAEELSSIAPGRLAGRTRNDPQDQAPEDHDRERHDTRTWHH